MLADVATHLRHPGEAKSTGRFIWEVMHKGPLGCNKSTMCLRGEEKKTKSSMKQFEDWGSD